MFNPSSPMMPMFMQMMQQQGQGTNPFSSPQGGMQPQSAAPQIPIHQPMQSGGMQQPQRAMPPQQQPGFFQNMMSSPSQMTQGIGLMNGAANGIGGMFGSGAPGVGTMSGAAPGVTNVAGQTLPGMAGISGATGAGASGAASPGFFSSILPFLGFPQ